jgi:hypothetical protein
VWYNYFNKNDKNIFMKIVAIDESGDPGNKLGLGSSFLFVYSFVVFDKDYLEFLNKTLSDLSEKYYKNKDHEFHFTNETHKQRRVFLESIINLNIDFNVFIYDKKLNKTNEIKKYVLECAFKNIKTLLEKQDIFIKIDGVLTRLVKKDQATQVRKIAKLFNLNINKIGFYDSKNNRDIQVADMIAGAIRKHEEHGDPNDIELFNILKSKVNIVYV